MKLQPLRCTCLKCAVVFDAEIVTNAPVSVALASMKAVRCPGCGSKKIGLGGAHTDTPPPAASSIEQRYTWWEERGDVGVSSQTIASAFLGVRLKAFDADRPYDPEDYCRCRALFKLIPEWRKDLDVVTKAYPWLAPFMERWDEMDRLYEEEAPSGMCPKLYDLMQEIGNESGRLRNKEGAE